MNKYSNSAPSKDTTRTNQPNISVVQTHGAPSAFIDLNGSTGATPHSVNRTEVLQPTEGNSIPAKYYLMLIWSVFNLFLGSILCGIAALFLSIKALQKRRSGNLQDARRQLKQALVCNILVTIGGIVFLIILIVILTT